MRELGDQCFTAAGRPNLAHVAKWRPLQAANEGAGFIERESGHIRKENASLGPLTTTVKVAFHIRQIKHGHRSIDALEVVAYLTNAFIRSLGFFSDA